MSDRTAGPLARPGFGTSATDVNKVEQHVRILAWLYIGFEALALLIVALSLPALIRLGAIQGNRSLLVVLGVSAALLFVVPGLIVAWGLLKRRPWARILALILAFLGLANFPADYFSMEQSRSKMDD